jgi:hypothetical protein
MIEIFSPNPIEEGEYFEEFSFTEKPFKLFLGGSIEQGIAKPWQQRVSAAFKNDRIVILNPRRPQWDSSWKNVASNKQFRQQVEWELNGLETCTAALMYFDPNTKSPISLLETGLFAHDRLHNQSASGSKLHVVCPKGFWRKGNVDIVCERYYIDQYSSLTKAIAAIKELI